MRSPSLLLRSLLLVFLAVAQPVLESTCPFLPATSKRTSAGGHFFSNSRLQAQTAREWIYANEGGMLALSISVESSDIDALVDSFIQSADSITEVAGLLLVPTWYKFDEEFWQGTDEAKKKLNAGFSTLGKIEPGDLVSAGPTPDDPDGFSMATNGVNIFVAAWRNGHPSRNERDFIIYGIDSFAQVLDPFLPDSDTHLSLVNSQLELFSDGRQENDLGDHQELEIAFLPYDDYTYLSRDTTYFSPTQQQTISGSSRSLLIERALAGQTFDLGVGGIDSLAQFRTFSMRPRFTPSVNDANMEAGMAFKLAYYCPPYWVRDPGPDTLSGTVNFFQQPDLPPPTDSIDIARIESSIVNLAYDSETQIQRVLQNHDQPTSWKDVSAYLLSNWWLILLLILALVLVFILGRASNNDVG